MNKCVRIVCMGVTDTPIVLEKIHTAATKLRVEGQIIKSGTDEVVVMASGSRDAVDQLVDSIHHLQGKKMVREITVEPFLKDKDYRGVFRIIT